jgi:hypothetical protein
MFTPALKDYTRHVRRIHERITDTEPLKDRNTDELRKCGPFEELGGVSLLQWVGKTAMVSICGYGFVDRVGLRSHTRI